MAGRILPDTNVVIAFFAGDVTVISEFNNADEIFLASVVLGELYYGARKSARSAQNVARVDAFAGNNVILSCDLETSQQYGVIKETLRAKGRMIPDNDIWIAATALQYALTLATRDSHFNEVDGLLIESW